MYSQTYTKKVKNLTLKIKPFVIFETNCSDVIFDICLDFALWKLSTFQLFVLVQDWKIISIGGNSWGLGELQYIQVYFSSVALCPGCLITNADSLIVFSLFSFFFLNQGMSGSQEFICARNISLWDTHEQSRNQKPSTVGKYFCHICVKLRLILVLQIRVDHIFLCDFHLFLNPQYTLQLIASSWSFK